MASQAAAAGESSLTAEMNGRTAHLETLLAHQLKEDLEALRCRMRCIGHLPMPSCFASEPYVAI